jgi:alkylation response protein AidB-like acyl-CoA dehydrogenase
MKTIPEADATPVLDTSRMSAGQKAAIEMTEAAREPRTRNAGFAASIFDGAPDHRLLLPFPAQTIEDKDQGDAFLKRLKLFLDEHVDADAIDREGEIPDSVFEGLSKLGAFGIKIPVKLGGLGLSQANYSRVAMLLGGFCGNLTALLSAHQSIGVPQPLLMFGTDEQKRRYLPRCAAGEITAFALTEPEVGSDPARMKTTATPDGDDFLINGEKLWCTNGTKAGLLIVMARTPSASNPMATTAFIVEANAPGLEVIRRCHFMGLRALYNGVIRFTNVRVSHTNIIGGEGKGLRVALATLNTGRITLPAACAGLSKRCLEISTNWARKREQWGQPIGRHAAIAEKIARMSANTFAMEAVVHYISALVDRDKNADVRLEAAMAKLWASERSWEIVNDTMQIRGGRGYETAESLRARGERPDPVERLFRDARINTIFEGSSEIMRLFIAREMLDSHLKRGAAIFNARLPLRDRLKVFLRASAHYAVWFPAKLFGAGDRAEDAILHPALNEEWHALRRLSRRLARHTLYAMLRFGPKLEREQNVLGRLVDIGTMLFVLATAVGYAQQKIENSTNTSSEVSLTLKKVHFLGTMIREDSARLFGSMFTASDGEGYRLAQEVLM